MTPCLQATLMARDHGSLKNMFTKLLCLEIISPVYLSDQYVSLVGKI